jgi:5-methyltetrahydrofolate corrinoid/iron sulfur protein methyltransferase
MSGLNLNIIAERINDSVPSTHALFEAGDWDAVVALAKEQADQGAAFVDVNIGLRDPSIMADLVKRIQEVVDTPLCIDSPDPAIQRAGLEGYDPAKAGGAKPLVNSISELRMEFTELATIQPVRFLCMCTERSVDGDKKANDSAQEIFDTALRLSRALKDAVPGISNDDLFFDPGVAPIGADMTGMVNATIDATRMIHECEELAGCHMSVGLSNFSVQLPPRTADGSLVRTPLESAFLTLTNPIGMDHAIASTKKKYQKLEADHPALRCVEDVLKLDSLDRIMRVQEFYS